MNSLNLAKLLSNM